MVEETAAKTMHGSHVFMYCFHEPVPKNCRALIAPRFGLSLRGGEVWTINFLAHTTLWQEFFCGTLA